MPQFPLENPSFQALQKDFQAWLSALGYAPKTVYAAPLLLKEFLFFLENHRTQSLLEVGKDQVQAFMAYLSERPNQRRGGGLSLAHRAKYYQMLQQLNRFLRATQRWGFEMPPGGIQVEHALKAVLSQSQIQQLYAACGQEVLGLRDRAMLSIFYGCGLRRSEGIGLELEDVDWAKSLLLVRQGKNYRQRYVPLSSQVQADLAAYCQHSRPWLLTAPTSALLLSSRGRRIDGLTLSLRLKGLQAATQDPGLIAQPLTLHRLRHAVATHLLQNGLKLSQIALFLGHQSLASTQIYTHVS